MEDVQNIQPCAGFPLVSDNLSVIPEYPQYYNIKSLIIFLCSKYLLRSILPNIREYLDEPISCVSNVISSKNALKQIANLDVEAFNMVIMGGGNYYERMCTNLQNYPL